MRGKRIMENELNLAKNFKAKGAKIETQLKRFGVSCSLRNCEERILCEKYEFDLIDIKTFMKLKNAVKVLSTCMHENISITDDTEYAFALEIKKSDVVLNLVDTQKQFPTKDKFDCLIGVDSNDKPVTFNLRKTIHTLIAGATGMGKSSVINNIIYSLTSNFTPNELQLLMIDVKKSMAIWKGLPHLNDDPILNSCDAYYALDNISSILDERLETLAKKGKTKATATDFPYIVIIIDELSDLMLSEDRKPIEELMTHIAQVGRCANVSLIVATQNPLVRVCTSLIKANCPTRIALKMVASVDSVNILNNKNAYATLSECGEAIIRPANAPTETYFKACFLEDDQIKEHIKNLKGSK